MNKKALKIAYKLRQNMMSERAIKKELLNKYKINITIKEISKVTSKIKYSKYSFTDLELEKILFLYSNYANTDKLVSYLNIKYGYKLTYNKLKDLAHRNGIKKKSKNMYNQSFINRKDEYNIAELYNKGYTANEIAKVYGYKTRNSILQKLEKLNVKRRVWNEVQSSIKPYSWFSMERIDCELKAYLLGLLLTDGYVNSNRGYFGIDLTDKDVIEFIANKINIKYSSVPERDKCKNKYRIIIYGKNNVNNLFRLGVTDRKTFTTNGPQLKKRELKYLNYIIRGVIDGDGWIRKDGKEFFISSASEKFIVWCKNSLEILGFKDVRVRFISNEYNGIYLIRSAKKHNIELLKSKIYNKPFGMARKYDLLL